jgi:ribonuclease HI
MLHIAIHTDGASRGNPGPAAIAYTIEGLKEIAVEHFENIGHATNNQAEYRAMVAALEYLIKNNVSDSSIKCYSDSELLIKQIQGVYRVKDSLLRPYYQQILGYINQLQNNGNTVEFNAIRREANQRADYLANRALDNVIP